MKNIKESKDVKERISELYRWNADTKQWRKFGIKKWWKDSVSGNIRKEWIDVKNE